MTGTGSWRFRSGLGTGRASIVVAALVLPVIGCGPRGGTISGSLRYQGKPVAAGVVEFYDKSTGVGASAAITSGSFSFVAPLRPGTYAVTVIPPQPQRPEDPMPVCRDIPANYRDAKKSGLTLTVAPGANTLSVDLE